MNMHGGFKEIIFFEFWITKSVGGIVNLNQIYILNLYENFKYKNSLVAV
jgi:hypothetical protein